MVGVPEPRVDGLVPCGAGVAGVVVGVSALGARPPGAVLVCAVAGAVVVWVEVVGALAVVLGVPAGAGVVAGSVTVAAFGVLCVPADSLAPPQPASPATPSSATAA